jgi:hypothetical protein
VPDAALDPRTWRAWREVHQKFELDWWKGALADGHSDDPGHEAQWAEVRTWIEPHGDIIDIGCGPRPPFAPCTVIDPLANDYRKIVPAEWWVGVTVYARPAEKRIDGLQADTIICWNALDHLIGWKDVLDNMLAYGRPDATFAVATDFWPEPFDGHPGFPRKDFERAIAKRFRVIKSREPFGRHLALLMQAQ